MAATTWNKGSKLNQTAKVALTIGFISLFSNSLSAFTGRVWISSDAICTQQIEAEYKTDISDIARLKMIEGPPGGELGLFANKESILLRGSTPAPFGPEGTVSLWIKTDQKYQTGAEESDATFRILEIDNFCSLSFIKTKSTLDFLWKWDKTGGNTQYHDLHILTPEIPGPQWIQLTFRWSSSKGIFNCYINGTPYRQNEAISDLKPSVAQKITLCVSQIAFGEMIISDKMLEGQELSDLISGHPLPTLDKILGVEQVNKLDIEFIIGPIAYSNPLKSPKDIRGWLTEGDAKLTFDEGGLVVESAKPDGSVNEGNIVLWCGDDLPAHFIAKWKFQLISDYGLAMVMFCAKGQNGKNIFDPSVADRNGTYSQYVYGDINSYHITYYTNTPYSARNTCSLWKNTGFYLADYGPAVVDPGSKEIYNATLVKVGNALAMAINNWVITDFSDDGKRFGPVLDWGKIGFRQMKWTKMRYSNFEIYSIKIPEQKAKPAEPSEKPASDVEK